MTGRMRIVGYCCSYGGYSSADLAGVLRIGYSPDVMIIRIPCAGRIDVIHILKAFRDGADAVFVAGCLEKNCNFEYGNIEARKRVEHAKRLLGEIGIEKERVEMFNVASNQGWKFPEIVREMVSRVEGLGPNPLRKVVK
jgi:F420-non-reducing hydrogenase iron-sulfur subunit